MNKRIECLILLILALMAMIFAGTVSAQVPIGATTQINPFESSPTSHASNKAATYLVNPSGAYDTDWMYATHIFVQGNTSTDYSVRYYELADFTIPLDSSSNPLWVDLKIRYECTGTIDDKYRILWGVSTANQILTDWVSGAAAEAIISSDVIGRTWHNLAEPTDGVWALADLASLTVRFETQQVSTPDTGRKVIVYEVWATAYSSPLPPTASTTTSVQPALILGTPEQHMFFVDIYVIQVTELAGFEFSLGFDTAYLTPFQAWSYWPFTRAIVTIDDAAGIVNIVALAFRPLADTGWDGDGPLARIYFMVDTGGSGQYKDLSLLVSKLGKPDGTPITHTIYNGWFATPRFMSLTTGILPPGDPTGTVWHELYPTHSTMWTITSWEDNGDEHLSLSDRIDMKIPGWTYWYHVDQVTTAIHFTFKAPDTGTGDAESELPAEEMPPGDPTYTRWHTIYPDYCRTFTITSWEDNGDEHLSLSDQFSFEFDDDPGVIHGAHLDSVSTDLHVSQTGPRTPDLPEFPLGISVLMSVAALIPMVYMSRTRPKKNRNRQLNSTARA